ncbi:MAG: SUMF1/EgtB/PvdO family nonheme iron enzyme [bacterium]|nr:SUMF1/EgtB/PvdO family nonheme iron enzyme [bacterium]
MLRFIWLLAFCLIVLGSPTQAAMLDTEKLAEKIARSLSQVSSPKYATLAFSRIQGGLDQVTRNELIDYANVSIVRSRAFRVIDRSKLTQIIDEQKFNLSGMVSQDTYKQLGKLLGVDLFVYGRFYGDVLVMKAIDVERSTLVWAEIFQTGQLEPQSQALGELAQAVSASLEKDLKRLKANGIRQISFWNISSQYDQAMATDFLSAALTKAGSFQVIDRDNLALILQEQQLNMSDFIDQAKAKKMGEIYGVDAFIYGSITEKRGQQVASFKLLNIYTGVIEWADLIRFGAEPAADNSAPADPRFADMILIPAGEFMMGHLGPPEISSPAFKLNVSAFYIDRQEVSNGEYAAYTSRFHHRTPPHWIGGRVPPGEEMLPVVNVNWMDARRYCQTQGKRLPQESEWEKAFRGVHGRQYPWPGTSFAPDAARTVESGIQAPLGVNELNADISSYGVRHLAGNVREWTESILKSYPGSRYVSGKINSERVIRGGSWAGNQEQAVGWRRDSSDPKYGWKDVGFRCARDPY